MADFTTHITTSTAIGAFYAVAGHTHWDVPIPTCLVAAGLCSVAGILPDVDSDSGHAQRELLTFSAAVIPMLMMDRFTHFGFTHEQMVLAGGCIYVLVRFGLGELLQRFTVHRGMWHSIPAAAIAGIVASLVCSCEDVSLQLFKVFAVVVGYLAHLSLDELWAIEWYRGRLRFKNSFGTAMKMFGRSGWANVLIYAQLLLIGALAMNDHAIMEQFGTHPAEQRRMAREWVDQLLGEEYGELQKHHH